MNYQELQRELLNLIQDASPAVLVSVPDIVNESVQQIAEDVNLPTLLRVFTVTTSVATYYVNTPATFSGRLNYVGDSTTEYGVIDGGLEALIRLHPDIAESGDIDKVALEGNVLYYLPIPSVAVTLTCIGYNFPATLVSNTDTPTDIPLIYHREAIVNRAAAIAYSIIESGALEEDKINFKMFNGLAEAGLNKIRAWAARRRSNVVISAWTS